MQIIAPITLLTDLLSPEEMVAALDQRTLRTLLDEWEAEIAEWGQAIWERRGETLRLRERHAELRDTVEFLMSFAGGSAAEAARLLQAAAENPGKPQRTSVGLHAR